MAISALHRQIDKLNSCQYFWPYDTASSLTAVNDYCAIAAVVSECSQAGV